MFSATSTILSGTQRRPDIYTYRVHRVDPLTNETTALFSEAALSWPSWSSLSRMGYIPLVSTFTGSVRSFLGVVHCIVHLACAMFDKKNRFEHIDEAKLGVINIGRGMIEMIPIGGNIAMLVTDVLRSNKFMNQLSKTPEEDQTPRGYAILFGNGKEIVKLNQSVFDQKVSSEEKLKIFLKGCNSFQKSIHKKGKCSPSSFVGR